jgi:RNA polymerase sigma-70 factor (ECF subfamily)
MNTSKTKEDEAKLVRSVLSGNKDAYGQIFRLYRQKAYGLAYQYTGNKEDALDIVQDAFIRAYLNLRKFDLTKKFGPWLLTIVRNLSIDLLRKRKKRVNQELPAVLADERPGSRADERLLLREIRQALTRLGPDQREIIYLKDYEGHSYAEISEIVQIPLGTVMSRLHHARKKLAELVREEDKCGVKT